MSVKPSMLDGLKNGFAILQVKRNCQKRFLSLEALGNEVPDIRDYNVVYTHGEKEMNLDDPKRLRSYLENIFYIFNVDHPEGFTGHSLSVSDIVAVIQNGKVSYHFVDSIGFVELVGFGKPIIQIGNYKCYLVDEWEGCGEKFQLGSSPTNDLVFYYSLAKPSGIDLEYDFRPTRDEVEDYWINEIAALDIAAHDEDKVSVTLFFY